MTTVGLNIPLRADLLELSEPRGAMVRRDPTKWIKRGTHRSVGELTQSIQTWITGWNENFKP